MAWCDYICKNRYSLDMCVCVLHVPAAAAVVSLQHTRVSGFIHQSLPLNMAFTPDKYYDADKRKPENRSVRWSYLVVRKT